MLTIRNLLREYAPQKIVDQQLSWGAKASAYRSEITQALKQQQTPVLIELENDLELDSDQVIWVDHHGPRAGAEQPTALQQIFSLLKLPDSRWDRHLELVSENDRGGIEALVNRGATAEEIAQTRAADRKAQGITLQQEQEGRQAALEARTLLNGRLTVVSLPHSRTATVTDTLAPALGGPGYENLLIESPHSVHVFGEGGLIQELAQRYPEGWYGGALPQAGFWGHARPLDDLHDVLQEYFGD